MYIWKVNKAEEARRTTIEHNKKTISVTKKTKKPNIMSIWTSLASWAKAGIPSSSSVLNTGLTMLTNYRNRQNALADQRALNAYNSPLQQMQRFKEAGLNPNLIYKQTNEGAAVRSSDAIAPKIDETALDVLGKSNAIEVQNLNKESMRLRNQNQKLQNEVLRESLPDLKEKQGIQNRVGNATYDSLVEGTNLKRQERSQKDTINPLEAKRLEKQNSILDQQFIALSQDNHFNKLSRPIQIEIAKITKDNLEKTGKLIETDTQLKEFQMRMNSQLENLGIGTGLIQDIIKILVSKIF